LMTFALWAYAFAITFTRASAIALEREQHTDWARQWAAAAAGAGKA
jgi:hypothetical protein